MSIVILLVAWMVFIMAITTLTPARYLIAVIAAAIAMAASSSNAEASSAKFCVAWSDTSTEMFSMRKRGLSREDVKELASDGKEWSVASDYALKHAFESSEKMDLEAYRMKKFRQCREDDV